MKYKAKWNRITTNEEEAISANKRAAIASVYIISKVLIQLQVRGSIIVMTKASEPSEWLAE